MDFKVVVYRADIGGYFAEVPSLKDCFTQGDTFDEAVENLYEIIEKRLSEDEVIDEENKEFFNRRSILNYSDTIH